ncbi:MAG: metallophosphoesterase [Kiritimatiellae bacterium]|nr:metallophosphoesterase [Kiritimatiellia bacterium]
MSAGSRTILRFAVLGDTHFCRRRVKEHCRRNCPFAELPDHVRYNAMRDAILAPMFAKIREMHPDFVISTGDFVEGGMRDREKTYREMRQGWKFMRRLGVPCLIAKGTHEGSGNHPGAEAYREIVLRGMAARTGQAIDREYFRYELKNNLFVILDYLNYDEKQDRWFEDQLKAGARAAKHIFVAAHPPLYNWGRHFFINEPTFVKRIAALCEKYPVDAYFCGHTHNQAVSFHETGDKKGYLQITASSVGYPGMDLVALDEFHVLAEFSPRDRYLWGILEDSSPGFYFFECKNGNMRVDWFSFKGHTASFSVKGRRTLPVNVKLPEYRKTTRVMKPGDFNQVKAAWLYIYGIYGDNKSTRLIFNGHDCGELPVNNGYTSRRYVLLDEQALESIASKNEVKIRLPCRGEFVLGSVSLELILMDHRIIHSAVCPELFVCGERWKLFRKPRKYLSVRNGQTVILTIMLFRENALL